ncbi:MAG: PQQ-like beta-propeller repeat protein [Acidobacteriota bacterium]|jgi:outer membrane protein assembly factor BamB
MRAFSIPAAFALAAALFTSPAAIAADWPGWLGPLGNATSPETGVFGSAAPSLRLQWKKPLGIGYAGIGIVDGKVVTAFAADGADWLVALNAGTGAELWRYRIDETFPATGGSDGGQNGTPVIRDGVIYGLGSGGKLFAVKLADGSEIWSVRVDREMGAKQPPFGFATAPLVIGDRLFVQTGGEGGHSLTGIDRKTGERVWSLGDDTVGYQSPILAELAGTKQILAVTDRSVLGLRPDGTELWRKEHGLVEQGFGWATPVLTGDGRFLLTGGVGSHSFRVQRGEDGFAVSEVWRTGALKGSFALPVLHEGHLYGFDGDFLACVDAATGERVWKVRSGGLGLILVDGHLVFLDDDGSVVVVSASPEGYVEAARLSVSGSGSYTYPAFSDGSIYVRNLEEIVRVDVGRAGP